MRNSNVGNYKRLSARATSHVHFDINVDSDNRGNSTWREREHSTSIPLAEVARLLDELRLSPLRASGGNNLSEGCQRQRDLSDDGTSSL